MSSMVMPALLSLVFALSFLILAFMQRIDVAAEIYQAAVERFVTSPWQLNPVKTIHDVSAGVQVYEWMEKVFINQLYTDRPEIGGRESYCTSAFPCLLGEGNVDSDEECAGSLQAGERNCPAHLGSRANCCKPCFGADCPTLTVKMAGTERSANTSVEDLSASCAETVPSWLGDLSYWQSEDKPPISQENMTFCPERISKVPGNLGAGVSGMTGPLLLARYNLVLQGRITMKRRKFRKFASAAFSNAYPKAAPFRKTDAYSYRPEEEDTESFGTDTIYNYERDKGFYGAGGFIQTLDLDRGKRVLLKQISKLKRDNWFDLSQGSFAVELLIYNGNVNLLLNVALVFEHDMSGRGETSFKVSPVSFTIHDLDKPETYVRLLLYLVIIIIFMSTLKTELEDMSVNYRSYFSHPMGFIRVTIFVLVSYTIAMYLSVVFSYPFLNFALPLSTDASERGRQCEELARLAVNNETANVAVSVTCCLVFVQAIAETTTLAPQLRLVVQAATSMKAHFMGFFATAVIMVVAFAQAGQTLFGTRLGYFSTTAQSVLTVVEMVQGKRNYEELLRTDPTLGDGFFLFFHFFFLIFLQFLASVVVIGYLNERKRLSESEHSESYPLFRFLRSLKAGLQHYATFIRRCIVSLQALFGGRSSGGVTRVDYEQVARLKDKRATKPVMRTVLYEQRQEESDDQVEISKDVTLRAVEPFYPDGMMHFYVTGIDPDGPASDYKVQKEFRLVGIQSQGVLDREKFRDPEHFKKINGDPQQLFDEYRGKMPVKLEFQGRVMPLSAECIIIMFFCIIYLVFMLEANRVKDVFNLTAIHMVTLTSPSWMKYDPPMVEDTESMNFQTTSVTHWVEEALVEGEMRCVSDADEPACNADVAARSNWNLYARVEEDDPGLKLGSLPGVQNLDIVETDSMPKAAAGLTFGYFPSAGVNSTEAEKVVRLATWNVGVMHHNHVRMTVQVPCFHANADERYKPGYPYVMDASLTASENCADDACMRRSVQSEQSCHSFSGERRDPSHILGSASKLRYSYSDEDGTYGGLGGIAVGMGNTPVEAAAAWNMVSGDDLHAISTVFETVSYNANLDMFTYTTVKFHIKGTGKVGKDVQTVVFPLNVFDAGLTSFREEKTASNWALFVLYITATLLFLLFLLRDLFIQMSLTSTLGKNWNMFMFDFLADDVWNCWDIACLVLNALVINSILRYILIQGGFTLKEGFTSWTISYAFGKTASPDTADAYAEFGLAASMYKNFSELAALNGLFVMVRFTKYFRCLTSLRLMLRTLSAALFELVIISAVILVVLVAFVFAMHIRFGILMPRFGTLSSSAQELFLFQVGQFKTEDLYNSFPVFFLSLFIVFQVAFILILNVFVSAIIFRWADTRRDAEDFSITGFFRTLKHAIQNLRSSKNTKNAEEEKRHAQSLDSHFWQQLSILRYIASLDESGKIVMREGQEARETHQQHEDRDGEEEEGSEAGSEAEEHGRIDFASPDGRKRFIKVFKKAHMEIASQMCRAVELRKDTGGGVALTDDAVKEGEAELETALKKRYEEENEQEMIGIIEEPQAQDTVMTIKNKLNEQLERSERPALEIWLDALVTVLEEAGALAKLQGLFLPEPMILPKKAQEWTVFEQKKKKMERRLNRFLALLEEQARVKHYQYLKNMAVSKERVLKQQSLVLTDYLQTLDQQIEKLQEEIATLEQKNSSMRSYVSPLL
eukprot:TRINITY_DN24986_c0_g1_i1.p1 TRINITY_DN24986_c0_g1~~TRINITY_DN24986_c0_g1_i1.p1  ORF type:complete len:1703 (-),score=342.16 TRINITY_DN24986_c0_g1_i1:24-5132(-)